MQCPQLSFSLQRELSGSYQNLHRHQISSECSPDWGLQHPKVLSLEIPALPSLSPQCMFRKMVCFPRWCGKCAEVFWKEFKREHFCLGMQHSCKEAHFDDIHLLQIKIGWNRGLWSELVQRDKQGDWNWNGLGNCSKWLKWEAFRIFSWCARAALPGVCDREVRSFEHTLSRRRSRGTASPGPAECGPWHPRKQARCLSTCSLHSLRPLLLSLCAPKRWFCVLGAAVARLGFVLPAQVSW